MKSGGTGSVFLVKGSDIHHYKFYKNGECHRGSTGKRAESEARKVLMEKILAAGAGKLETAASRRMTLADLRGLVIADYERQGFDSAARQEDAFFWLMKFFGERCPVAGITSARIEQYVKWRPTQPDARSFKRKLTPDRYPKPPRIGCSRATINRELSALRHAFELARRQGKLATAPYIKLHKERNRRMGTFQFGDFAALREALPEYLRAPVTVAFFTGWRLASEILTRKKSHLVDGWLMLEVGEGKNEEPRRFPLDLIPELREVIEAQLAATRELEKENRPRHRVAVPSRGQPHRRLPSGVAQGLRRRRARGQARPRFSAHRRDQSNQRRSRSAHGDGTGRMEGYQHVETLPHHSGRAAEARGGEAQPAPRRAENPSGENNFPARVAVP